MRRALLLLLLAVSVPRPARPQEFSLFEPEAPDSAAAGLPARLSADLGAFALHGADFDRRRWRRLGYGLLAVAAVSAADDELRDAIRDGSDGSFATFAETVRPLGQEGGLALLGLTWAAGRALDRPRLQLIAEDGLEASILAAGVLAPAIKAVAGRSRPRDDLGSESFTLFSDGQSFPSGEATELFAIAAVVSTHARSRWIKGLAWGLAGTVALQRVQVDGHWPSDVLAGALLGAGVGHWVARRHLRLLDREARLDLAPVVGRERYGFGVRVAW